jgi:chemotaxis protein MotA
MKFLVGSGVVLGCVSGGYIAHGGHMDVLWQPFEFLIILGAAIGAFIIGQPKIVLKNVKVIFQKTMKGAKYDKKAYVELLVMLYQVLKLVKTKGALAIEPHVDKPHDSPLFHAFPIFSSDHHAVEFLCDYLRLWTLGTDNPNELEMVFEKELENHHAVGHALGGSVQSMADGMPALGIVAAVLGVIHTMGSISEPPEVLGKLIGSALVGTFFGVFVAYGFLAPMASSVNTAFESESHYFNCMKVALLSHMQGYAPAIAVEFARKALPEEIRATFAEVEEAVSQAPNVV